MITVYGVPGWGSTISELMLSRPIFPTRWLTWRALTSPVRRASVCDRLIRCAGAHPEAGRREHHDRNRRHRADDPRPASRSGPAPGTPQRPQFQRLLVWLVANVYPTFTYADYPERWAPAAAEQLVENCRQYRKNLYLWFEQQLAAGPWALGASVTLLDCYIAAMYRWGPRQAWFDDHAPKFAAIARAVCQRPELAAALRRNKLI